MVDKGFLRAKGNEKSGGREKDRQKEGSAFRSRKTR